jgi:Zn-dependent peptidase ImmA (M78 family)/transcriptional regulator with XRE-family HTH domain
MSSELILSPDRLRSFRLVRGWSLDDLASHMTASGHSITRQALHQFEKGKTAPAPTTFRALVSALGLRPSELLESSFALQFVAFRKTSKLGKSAQEIIKAEFSCKAERRQRLLAANGIQPRPWSLDKRRVDTVEGAEEVARWLRDEWHLGRDAISSLTDACEHNGVEVVCLAPEADGFSGLSAFESSSRSAFIAFQRRATDGARQRMDLAHELAHLVLDPESEVKEEEFARRFAGALLLPAETVRAELGQRRSSLTFSELRALKVRYGVSMQGWVRRAKDLHVISESTYKGFQISVNRYGLRTDEGQPYVALEICDRDMRLAARATAEGLLDATEAARLAGIKPEELTNGLPVPKRRSLSSLTREERRAAASQAAAFAAEDFHKHPESRVPDIFDHAD